MVKKKVFISIVLVLGLLFVSRGVMAAEKQTSSSTINGVTVNWEYEVNKAGEIENLKCTNASELTGNITIPGALDGKTVVSVGNEAFKSATNVTGVTVSDSIQSIAYSAFANCTNLNKVDLGNINYLSFRVFSGCTSLKEITIPKTLEKGSTSPCLDNPNITKITLEEGLTVVPSNLCANTGITEITIPNSVTNIEYNAFANCKNLNKVDLGNINYLSFRVFSGCTSLKEITIPKTLKKGSTSPCLDNPNITKITLEEGLTVVPTNLCANTGITEITIPNSVTNIEYSAFYNCPNLKKITILDNVTSMGFYNTHNSDSIFENHNPDLTIYCYEDSLAAKYAIKYNIKYVYLTKPKVEALEATVKYSEKDKTTGKITVTITTNKKVKKVEGWTLSEDGKTLTKTYSKNVKENVNLEAEDGQKTTALVTISSFEESKGGNENATPTDKGDGKTDNKSNNQASNKADNTIAPSKIPQTGVSLAIVFTIIALGIVAVITLNKFKEYKNIK